MNVKVTPRMLAVGRERVEERCRQPAGVRDVGLRRADARRIAEDQAVDQIRIGAVVGQLHHRWAGAGRRVLPAQHRGVDPRLGDGIGQDDRGVAGGIGEGERRAVGLIDEIRDRVLTATPRIPGHEEALDLVRPVVGDEGRGAVPAGVGDDQQFGGELGRGDCLLGDRPVDVAFSRRTS